MKWVGASLSIAWGRGIAEQSVERIAKRAGVDRVEPPLARQQGREPLVEPREQRPIAKVGNRLVMRPRERRPLAKRDRAVAEWQDRESMPLHRRDQPRLDRRRVGLWIGRG